MQEKKNPLYLEEGRLNKKYIELLKTEIPYRLLPVGRPYRTAIFQCDDCLLFFNTPQQIETHQKAYDHKGVWMISIVIYADLTCKIQKHVIEEYPKPEDDYEMEYGKCELCANELTEETVWSEHFCKECARRYGYIS